MLDEDVSRVSAGGVRAIGAAAELWLVKMAERAVGVAATNKRKTLKFSDVQAVRAVEAWSLECFVHAAASCVMWHGEDVCSPLL